MSTILHIEDAQRLQRNPDRAYKPDIIDKYSRYSSGVYAPLQREGRFPDTRPADQRIDTRPYQPSTYSELLELEASLPKRHSLAKVQVGVCCWGMTLLASVHGSFVSCCCGTMQMWLWLFNVAALSAVVASQLHVVSYMVQAACWYTFPKIAVDSGHLFC